MVIEETKEADKVVENFLVLDWQGGDVVILCIKCEELFNIDPCSDADKNLIWCSKKKVLVPQCPHCQASDIE